MKSIGVVILTAMLMFMTVAPAAAQDGGVYTNPLATLLLLPFAVAATITVGVATVLTAPFAYPYTPYPAAYSYPYSFPYPYPYTYDVMYLSADPPPPPSSYWYYCVSAGAYYPTTPSCPEQWIQVAPRSQ